MVLVDSHGISRVPRYSGTCPASQKTAVYGAVTVYGRPFQTFRLPCWFLTPYDGPYNPAVHARRFGLFRVRSPLLAESLTCFLFLEVLRWFTSLRCPPRPMDSAGDLSVLTKRGFPIRASRGQSLFAAHQRAYRSLPRPSSTSSAKAFTVRS